MAEAADDKAYVAGLEQALVALADVCSKAREALIREMSADPGLTGPGSASAAFDTIPMLQGTRLLLLVDRIGAARLPMDKAGAALALLEGRIGSGEAGR